MDKVKIGEWLWKGFTILLSLIIVPCFIWVWEAEGRLAGLEYEVADVDENVKRVLAHLENDDSGDLSDIKVSLELIKRDIQKANSDIRSIKKNYRRK
tara:strand:- start:266 stop:556 length:291 start_codon:yes stop_codon:yes gene_type:complete